MEAIYQSPSLPCSVGDLWQLVCVEYFGYPCPYRTGIHHPKGSMPRKMSEERMCGEHAHKEMNAPQLEQAGWVLRDYACERAKVVDDAK